MDSIEYVCDRLLPALTVNRKMGSSCDPPSLLVIKMEMAEKLVKIRGSRSEEIVLPEEVTCCGFAGDCGFLVPTDGVGLCVKGRPDPPTRLRRSLF